MQMTPEELVRHQQIRINELENELEIVTRQRDEAGVIMTQMAEKSRMHLEEWGAAKARARENFERGRRLIAERKELKLKVKEANTEAEEAQAQLLEARKELASARDNVWAAEDRIGVLNALLGEAQSQKDAAELEVRLT